MGIARLHMRQVTSQQRDGRGHEAGVDLMDCALTRRGVAFLDDTLHTTCRAAQDPPITCGIGRLHHQQRDTIHGRILQRLQCPGRHQRDIAVEDERRSVGQMRQGLGHGMSRTALLALLHPAQIITGTCGLNRRHAVPSDHMDRLRGQRPRRGQHMSQQGLAAERLQHLGQRTVHARALARGKHDHTRRHPSASSLEVDAALS